jgi:hypothetical protein
LHFLSHNSTTRPNLSIEQALRKKKHKRTKETELEGDEGARHHTIDGERVHGRVDDGDDGDAVDAHLQLRPPLGHHRGDLPTPVNGGYSLAHESRPLGWSLQPGCHPQRWRGRRKAAVGFL